METSFIKKKLLFAGQSENLSAQLVSDLSDIFEIKIIDEAINVYKESRKGFVPDIIVVDLEQSSKSGMSSIQLLRACKGDEILHKIPFIFLTSRLNPELIAEIKNLRADDLFSKTYSIENLRVRLKYLANRKRSVHVAVKEPAVTETPKKSKRFPKISVNGIQRVIDVFVTSIIIILLSPLIFFIGFLVKISSKGPVLTRSKFVGMDHSEFYLLRFRTAQIITDKSKSDDAENKFDYNKYHNTENKTLNEKERSLIQSSPRKIKFTKLGLFLHKTGLENLPQLFNVMYGDLSLIGIKPVSETEISNLSELEWVKRIFKPVGFTLFNFRKISQHTKDNLRDGINITDSRDPSLS